jgi:hypothetical protein
MAAVWGARVRGAVAVAAVAAQLGAALAGCTASHGAPPPGPVGRSGGAAAAASAPATPLAVVPSPHPVTAGAVIAPGAREVVGQSVGVRPARRPVAPRTPPAGTLRELQMNLCNSGEASCYTGGRSIGEATALMQGAARPDLVTLNEVCRGDVADRLAGVMAGLWPHDDIVYLFAPALNAAGGAYRCQNGDAFGNGLIARVPAGLAAPATRYGVFELQATDIEMRTFGCVDLVPRLAACVTHLESVSAAVAANQCTTLLRGVVPALRRAWGAATPVLVAGDMNLGSAVAACTPAGFGQVGDGGVQHVFGSGIRLLRADRFRMHQTDHDALLVTLATP